MEIHLLQDILQKNMVRYDNYTLYYNHHTRTMISKTDDYWYILLINIQYNLQVYVFFYYVAGAYFKLLTDGK